MCRGGTLVPPRGPPPPRDATATRLASRPAKPASGCGGTVPRLEAGRRFDVVREDPYPSRRTYVRRTRPGGVLVPAETTLTARQQEIWQFLVTYVDGHGYPATVREIGEEGGLASPSTVHAHLANL